MIKLFIYLFRRKDNQFVEEIFIGQHRTKDSHLALLSYGKLKARLQTPMGVAERPQDLKYPEAVPKDIVLRT